MQILILLVLLTWTNIVIGQTSSITGESYRSQYIIINNQNIYINPEKIKVISEYTNTSNKDITETIVFTTPVNISVDNEPEQIQIISHALSLEGRDITKDLNLLGIPLDPIAAMHAIDASGNRDNIIGKLLGLNLIDQKENIPNWNLKTYYYWQHTFLANDNTTVEYNYKPTVNIKNFKINNLNTFLKKAVHLATHLSLDDSIAYESLQQQLQKYILNIDASFCPSNQDYQTIATVYKSKKSQKILLETKTLSFKYNSNDLWYSPIKKFTLNIESNDDAYPIMCWNNKLERDINNSLQFKAENYVPMQEISVLYINK